ncbi:alpha/beta fold hydrolase [Marisediminicola sp. LYQ134]|uniref:alpha/beta fold hydrolase n=1 Tax=unclassified Marisediminicola TaxID=2618316 RepID=UPI003982DEDE
MSAAVHSTRTGSGAPLVLVHGLGSSSANWAPVLGALAAHREVVTLDLPGFGASAPLAGPVTIATLTDALQRFLTEEGLDDADVVGSSMGARMVLELARRGHRGDVVALDPGGFWSAGQRVAFAATVRASVALVRAIQTPLPWLSRSAIARSLLLFQFSSHAWRLDPDLVLTELRDFARATSLDEALDALVSGPEQLGASTTPGRVAIGWGRFDRVTLPSQASVALERFPSASFHGFARCGHYPHWDQPAEAARFILRSTGRVD